MAWQAYVVTRVVQKTILDGSAENVNRTERHGCVEMERAESGRVEPGWEGVLLKHHRKSSCSFLNQCRISELF